MKVLKIEFGENEKAQNKKIFRYVRFNQVSEDVEKDKQECATCSKLFEYERELYYGPKWLNILFPYLNY